MVAISASFLVGQGPRARRCGGKARLGQRQAGAQKDHQPAQPDQPHQRVPVDLHHQPAIQLVAHEDIKITGPATLDRGLGRGHRADRVEAFFRDHLGHRHPVARHAEPCCAACPVRPRDVRDLAQGQHMPGGFGALTDAQMHRARLLKET
jgi:hypothetical protein